MACCKKNGEEKSKQLGLDITCFADCYSSTIVMRVPYEMAIDLLMDYQGDKENKEKLHEKMDIASRMSSKFNRLLRERWENGDI